MQRRACPFPGDIKGLHLSSSWLTLTGFLLLTFVRKQTKLAGSPGLHFASYPRRGVAPVANRGSLRKRQRWPWGVQRRSHTCARVTSCRTARPGRGRTQLEVTRRGQRLVFLVLLASTEKTWKRWHRNDEAESPGPDTSGLSEAWEWLRPRPGVRELPPGPGGQGQRRYESLDSWGM